MEGQETAAAVSRLQAILDVVTSFDITAADRLTRAQFDSHAQTIQQLHQSGLAEHVLSVGWATLSGAYTTAAQELVASTVLSVEGGRKASAAAGHAAVESFVTQAARYVRNVLDMDALLRCCEYPDVQEVVRELGARSAALDPAMAVASQEVLLDHPGAPSGAAVVFRESGSSAESAKATGSDQGLGNEGSDDESLSVDNDGMIPGGKAHGSTPARTAAALHTLLQRLLDEDRTLERRFRRCMELYWQHHVHAEEEEEAPAPETVRVFVQNAELVGFGGLVRECATEALFQKIDNYIRSHVASGSVSADSEGGGDEAAEEEGHEEREDDDDEEDEEAADSAWNRKNVLKQAKQWLQLSVLPQVKLLLEGAGTRQLLRKWLERARHRLLLAFCQTRIHELFNIIRDFPDSKHALPDFKEVLKATRAQRSLVRTLTSDCQKRLLLPGTATTAIIDFYISTIKVLRSLDPQDGVLLEAVSDSLRQALRARADTVKCIVRGLTDEDNENDSEDRHVLNVELRRSNTRIVGEADFSDGDDDNVDGEDAGGSGRGARKRWEPDPVEADPTRSARSRRTDDIISILINIYGNQDVFVQESTRMLADRLLNKSDFNVEQDTATLERLKLRFGDIAMHNNSVMLKDVDDSRRVNALVKSAIDKEGETEEAKAVSKAHSNIALSDFGSLIVSRHFWPQTTDQTVKFHPVVEQHASAFVDKYAVVKNPRTLEFLNDLGKVELTLESEDGSVRDFAVSTVLATVIMHFADQDVWQLSQLAEVTGLSEADLAQKLNFWVQNGIIVKEVRGEGGPDAQPVFVAAKNFVDGGMEVSAEEIGAGGSALQSDAQSGEEELNRYVQYIQGMLRSHQRLPAATIYEYLALYVDCDKTLPQIMAFLDHLVATEVLDASGGMYTIHK